MPKRVAFYGLQISSNAQTQSFGFIPEENTVKQNTDVQIIFHKIITGIIEDSCHLQEIFLLEFGNNKFHCNIR
jgi:hypothetical protein